MYFGSNTPIDLLRPLKLKTCYWACRSSVINLGNLRIGLVFVKSMISDYSDLSHTLGHAKLDEFAQAWNNLTAER